MIMQALGLAFAAVVVALAVAAYRGRTEVKACCPKPEDDLRMHCD